MMIHGGTLPLDWIISSNAGAADAIRAGFDGMFQPELLEFSGDHIRDHRFGFMHIHDFPLDDNFLTHRPKVLARYDLLRQRMLDALSSPQRVLFVRQEEPGVGGPAAAKSIADAIAKWRNPSTFHLLYINEIDGGPSDLLPANISQVKIDPDAGEDTAVWDRIFSDLHRREPIRGYFPAFVRRVDAMPDPIRLRAYKFFGNSRRAALLLRGYLT